MYWEMGIHTKYSVQMCQCANLQSSARNATRVLFATRDEGDTKSYKQ